MEESPENTFLDTLREVSKNGGSKMGFSLMLYYVR